MMSPVPPTELSLREWAERNGYALGTVRGWREDYPEFPEPSRRVGNTDLYFAAQLDRWKKAHPSLGLGPGGHKRKPAR